MSHGRIKLIYLCNSHEVTVAQTFNEKLLKQVLPKWVSFNRFLYVEEQFIHEKLISRCPFLQMKFFRPSYTNYHILVHWEIICLNMSLFISGNTFFLKQHFEVEFQKLTHTCFWGHTTGTEYWG